MQSAWNEMNVSRDDSDREAEAHPTGKRVIRAVLLVAVLGCVAVAGAHSTHAWSAWSATGSLRHVALSNTRGDVIGPDPALAAKQKEIYDNEKIIRTAHGQAKQIWLQVYQQFNATAHQNNDITLGQHLAMIYAQVHFHIDATSENVHLFIEDAAYGLWISYSVKTGWVLDANAYEAKLSSTGKEESQKISDLRLKLDEARSQLRGLKEDLANPGLAQTYLNLANTAYGKYQSLIQTGNIERKAWSDDLLARQQAQSMTFAQHLSSVALFVKYKITKTAELVQEYAWLINYTTYVRFAFGNTFVMNQEFEDAVKRLEEMGDLIMKHI